MRIGIISDIHSNIVALEAVFKEFERLNVDKIICLGDIIGIGPRSHECASFLMDKKDMIISWIIGNHERYLINGIPKTHHSIPNGNPTKKIEYDCYAWNHGQLTKEEFDFLKSRPFKDYLVIDSIKIVLEHYPYDDNMNFNRYYDKPTFSEIRSAFKNKDSDIYLYGHTHKRCINQENGIIYINPGSLGCPLENNMASVGILDIENEKYKYTNIDVKYDVESVIKDMEDLDYPMARFMIWRFYNRDYKYEE